MTDNTGEDEIRVPDNWARNFFPMWAGQAVSLIGSSLVQFALIWWLTKTTGSATILALASLVETLPRILIAPFAGTLVDRWNRKTVLIVADSIIAIATLVLMLLFATGNESILAVYVILLIRATGGSFHSPAEAASISLMVPQKHLARIAGLNQTIFGIINIISPPLGALLIGIFPIQTVIAIDIGTAAIAISILFFIIIPQPARLVAQTNGTAPRTSYWQDLRAGWNYMLGWPGLLAISIMAMVLNLLLTPSASLIPIMVTKEYGGSAIQLGLVDSMFGIGVIFGGLLLSSWGGFKKRIHTSLFGIAGIAAGILIFGLAPAQWFYFALFGILLMGFMQVLANGPLHAILQVAVAPDMQGRVFSLLGAGASAISPLSLLIAGPISDWLGVRSWYLVGGIATLIMVAIGFGIPAIMNIEENRHKEPTLDLK